MQCVRRVPFVEDHLTFGESPAPSLPQECVPIFIGQPRQQRPLHAVEHHTFAAKRPRPWRYGAHVDGQSLAKARAALAAGDALIAFDAASTAAADDPEDLEAAYLVALTLARAGASARAKE